MKRFFRYLIAYAISLILVFLSGYGNLMENISESLAVTSFIGATVILSLIIFVLIEMYIKTKSLSKRIKEIESKLESNK